jgi:hypothetical protein
MSLLYPGATLFRVKVPGSGKNKNPAPFPVALSMVIHSDRLRFNRDAPFRASDLTPIALYDRLSGQLIWPEHFSGTHPERRRDRPDDASATAAEAQPVPIPAEPEFTTGILEDEAVRQTFRRVFHQRLSFPGRFFCT